MEAEKAEPHSRLTLSRPGAVDLTVDPDPPSEEAVRARDAAQAETLKQAAETGVPLCEKCEADRPEAGETPSSEGA